MSNVNPLPKTTWTAEELQKILSFPLDRLVSIEYQTRLIRMAASGLTGQGVDALAVTDAAAQLQKLVMQHSRDLGELMDLFHTPNKTTPNTTTKH
jgi:hypothetical protein